LVDFRVGLTGLDGVAKGLPALPELLNYRLGRFASRLHDGLGLLLLILCEVQPRGHPFEELPATHLLMLRRRLR